MNTLNIGSGKLPTGAGLNMNKQRKKDPINALIFKRAPKVYYSRPFMKLRLCGKFVEMPVEVVVVEAWRLELTRRSP